LELVEQIVLKNGTLNSSLVIDNKNKFRFYESKEQIFNELLISFAEGKIYPSPKINTFPPED
jgi:hypothetical protein